MGFYMEVLILGIIVSASSYRVYRVKSVQIPVYFNTRCYTLHVHGF